MAPRWVTMCPSARPATGWTSRVEPRDRLFPVPHRGPALPDPSGRVVQRPGRPHGLPQGLQLDHLCHRRVPRHRPEGRARIRTAAPAASRTASARPTATPEVRRHPTPQVSRIPPCTGRWPRTASSSVATVTAVPRTRSTAGLWLLLRFSASRPRTALVATPRRRPTPPTGRAATTRTRTAIRRPTGP